MTRCINRYQYYIFCCKYLLPQGRTLFPYTTLFRSDRGVGVGYMVTTGNETGLETPDLMAYFAADPSIRVIVVYLEGRSEEHTSELQSPCNLVCRLLLEKKKYIV